jgi:hypothetical protein
VKARNVDEIEAAMIASIAAAFRRRAVGLRAKAASGVAVIDADRPNAAPVVIVSSEASALLRFAADWDEIAADLENGATK